jgi:hypothetical protein
MLASIPYLAAPPAPVCFFKNIRVWCKPAGVPFMGVRQVPNPSVSRNSGKTLVEYLFFSLSLVLLVFARFARFGHSWPFGSDLALSSEKPAQWARALRRAYS